MAKLKEYRIAELVFQPGTGSVAAPDGWRVAAVLSIQGRPIAGTLRLTVLLETLD